MALVAAVLSCGKDVTSPDAGARYARAISWHTEFPPAFQSAGRAASDVVPFDRVRVLLHHADGTVALDTVISFPSGADSETVSLDVRLLPTAPASGEPLSLNLDYINAAGDTVFKGGPVGVTAIPAAAGQPAPPPVTVPVSYSGPGASAVGVRISPRSGTAVSGTTFTFTAAAVDQNGATVPNAPIVWNTLDPSIATIPSAAAGTVLAGSVRGSARIQAQLLTGPADQVTLSVLPLPTSIAIQSGNGQTALAGAALANPLVAVVTAADGLGVGGVTVTFAVTSGGGSLGSATVVTNDAGFAQTTWKLGSTVGTQTATASSGTLVGSPLVFTATAKSATATRLAVTSQPGNAVAGASLAAVTVVAQTVAGDTAAFTGPVTLTLSGGPSGATLGGTTTVSAVGGVATFTGLQVTKSGTGYSLVASSTGLASASSSPFDIAPAAASKLVFTGQPTTGTVGSAISTIAVAATDAFGNTATGFTGAVTLALVSNPGAATLGGTATVNAVAGVATFGPMTLNRTGAGYTLSASATGLASAASAAFDVLPGGAASLVLLSGGGQSATVSTALPQPVVVQVQDLSGNGVAGKTVTFAVVTGGGSLSVASAVSDASGNVSTSWTLGATVGAQSISATSAGLAGSPLTIGATGNAAGGGATQLAFTVSPANSVAGVSVSPAIVVQARTAAGALAASFTGNVTLAIGANPGGATPSGTLTVAAVAGVATFSNVSLDKAGVGYTLVASAAALTTATSAAFNVTPAAASALAFTVQPATAAQTIAISPAIQVTARDAFGNMATTFTGTVTLGFSTNPTGAALSGTLAVAAVAGVATFSSVSVNLVGAGYVLGATSGALTAATSAPFAITAFSGAEMWNNPAGGSWSLASNWSLGRVPLPTDSIVISLSGTYTVTLDTTFTTSRYIILGGGTGTQNLALASRTLTLNGPMVVIAGGAFTATNSTVAGASAISNSGTVTLDGSAVSTTLANLGVVVVSGNSTLTAAGYASGTGSTLRIGQINGSSGAANLTVTGGGFTNNGTIELTNLFTVGYGSQITMGGTLTNAAGSTISILGGTTPGGARTISAALNNLGTLNVAQPLSLPAANAVHTNVGTINVTGGSVTLNQSGTGTFTNTGTLAIASGFAFGVNGGVFTHTSGSISGPGSLNLANATFTLNTNLSNASLILTLFSVTVNGTGTLTNATGQALTLNNTTLNAVSLVNQGLLVASGNSAINGAFTTVAGSTLQVGQVDGCCGQATLSVANSFTNNGAIEITNLFTVGYGSQLSMSTGTLTNAPGGTISILGGTTPGGARTLAVDLNNQGTITVAQPLSLGRASDAIVNSGTINVTGGSVTLSQTGTSPSFTNNGTISIASGFTFAVSNGTFTYSGGSITGPGTFALSSTTLALGTSFSDANVPVTMSSVTTNGPGTFTNATGQSLTLNNSSMMAPLVNQGTLIASANSLINGTFTTAAGSTLRVAQVDGCCGTATLTVTNPFTNNGTLELSNQYTVGYGSQITVGGTLTNAAGATINVLGGTTPGGSRTMAAQLDNQGTLNVAQPLTLNRASAVHSNTGTINITGGSLTITQSGVAPSFNNAGALSIGSGYSVLVSAGTFTYTSGTVTGPGSLAFSGMTFALASSYSTASAPVTISNSTITGPGTLTNAAGNTLTLNGVTVGAPMVNQGTLISSGASALNGTFTTAAGSTLRIGQVDGSTSNANLTVANGFTNNGAIELTVIFNAGYGAQLTVGSGTLTNAAGATITSLGGTAPGGARTITSAINNLGTVTAGAGAPLTINGTSATHTNAGTIDASAASVTVTQGGTTPSFTQNGIVTVGSGFTFGVNGGSFNVNVGATTGGAGNLALTNVTGGAINGPLAFGGATLSSSTVSIGVAVSTSGGNWTIQSNSNVGGAGSLTNVVGQTLTLLGSTLGIAVTNQGTLISSGASALNGALTAAAGSMLRIGQVDGSTSNANLTVANGFTNNGAIELTVTFNAGYGAQLTVGSGTLVNAAGATITSLGGASPGGARTLTAQLNNQGTVTAGAGAPLTINATSAAHTNSGTLDASAANISLSQGGTSPSLTSSGTITIGSGFSFSVTGGTLTQAAGPISGAGSLNLSGVTASLSALATPATLALTNSTVTLSGALSTATTALSLTSNSTINGTGSITNAAGQTLAMYGSAINTALTNNGILVASGASSIGGALTTAAGSTLRIGQQDGSTSTANLSVASGFTNAGTIELSDFFPAAYSAQLTVGGTLTNAAGGTISALAGTAPGGTRTISAPLVDNLGTINVLPGSAGTLTVTGSLTLDSTSVVNLEIGGIAAGTQFDQLVVQQYSTLGGTLNVSLINAFTPASGQIFKLIPSTLSTTPGFATLNLPATMTAVYNASDFTVQKP